MKNFELKLKEDKNLIVMIGEALSNKTRLEILDEIKKNKRENYKELAEAVGIKPSAFTFHINYLIDAKLVVEETGKGLKGRKTKIPTTNISKIVITL